MSIWTRNRNDRLKENNKGVSLVEILVALAVGTIVLSAVTLLVSQSIKSYKNQTTTSKLQNDANITINQIEESVMEATEIIILSEGTTQESDSDVEYFGTKGNIAYRYDGGEQRLYLSNGTDKGKTGYTESLLCENVTGFKVRVIASSIMYEGVDADVNRVVFGINKPVRISVSLTLEKDDKIREVSKESNVRNTISKISFKLGNSVSNIVDDIKTYDAIKAYLQ